MDLQKPGKSLGPERKIVERQRVAKERAAQKLRSRTVQNEMRGVLERVAAGAAASILESANPEGLAYLPTALSVALSPSFPFPQAHYSQVSLLKPAPFCTLFAGLGSTIKSATSLLFFSYLSLVLFSAPCPVLHRFSSKEVF